MSKKIIKVKNRAYKELERKYRKANEIINFFKNGIELKMKCVREEVEEIRKSYRVRINLLERKIKFERKLSLSAICILAGVIIILAK